jgi:sarcosine oxidase subunit alpha
MPYCNGLERNVRQCLRDFNIPLTLSTTVVEVKGRSRLEGVKIARVNDSLKPIAGTEQEIDCDTLLLSVGLIPENELAKKAGVQLSPLTNGAIVDDTLMTTIPGIFSCGNVLHIHDVADFASKEGFAAGKFAADFIRQPQMDREIFHLSPGENVRYCLPQKVHAGATNGIEIYFRVTRPLRDKRIFATGTLSGKIYFKKNFPRLLPSELEKIKFKMPVEEDLEISCHD